MLPFWIFNLIGHRQSIMYMKWQRNDSSYIYIYIFRERDTQTETETEKEIPWRLAGPTPVEPKPCWKPLGRAVISCWERVRLFALLFKLSVDCVRPTDLVEDTPRALTPVWISSQNTLREASRIMFDQLSGYPVACHADPQVRHQRFLPALWQIVWQTWSRKRCMWLPFHWDQYGKILLTIKLLFMIKKLYVHGN